MQENHYGAWGELLEGIGTSVGNDSWKFLFQSKEYVDAFGYNTYDFHARQYDPFTGRFDSIDPANQFASGYTGMGNQPTLRIDPDGKFAPLIFVAAAIIGGGGNLLSNWSKVKNWKQGLAYFASGAVGGAVSVVNPALGGSITAGANFGIDVVTGNVPNFKNGWDVAKYTGGLALDGFGVSGAGALSKFGISKLATYFSSEATSSVNGALALTKVGSEVGNFSLDATAELVIKPAAKFSATGAAQVAKQGLKLTDEVITLSEQNLSNSGQTVLGHFPDYIEKAKRLGASYYDIGSRWNNLTDAERWGANEHFLDVIAEKGDQVLLSLPKNQIRVGSYLEDEIRYLTQSKGYQWLNQWSLIKH